MRTLTLFALSVTGGAALTADASAIGKRNRGGDAAVYASASPCGCGGSSVGYSSYQPAHHGHASYQPGTTWHAASAPTVNGKDAVIRTTDGQVYTLGADGSYYAASSGMASYGTTGMTTLGGFTTQPYGSNMRVYGGTSSYLPNYGVLPAGYPGSTYGYPGVIPAGGTQPLTMPGVNIGPGGITIVPGIMPRNR